MLRGRVLTLLSGNSKDRTEYLRDTGDNPAVAMNSHGQIVEVHNSGSGELWYWTGTYGADGRVTWLRQGRYDKGVTPAVALNDNGWLVEVHQSQNATTLWYRVGRLGSDGEISWSASHQYDKGVVPTLAFTNTAGTTLREIHQSQNNSQNWTWAGVLNTGSSTVAWSGNAKTSVAGYNKTSSVKGASWVSVWTGTDGATPAQTLRYSTGAVSDDRIRYQQLAFVESQASDSDAQKQLQQGALFYGAPAQNMSFITLKRNSGQIVRGWDFDSASLATAPLANYPATNHPWAAWYQDLLTRVGAVE
jgi:hypothetical protein